MRTLPSADLRSAPAVEGLFFLFLLPLGLLELFFKTACAPAEDKAEDPLPPPPAVDGRFLLLRTRVSGFSAIVASDSTGTADCFFVNVLRR